MVFLLVQNREKNWLFVRKNEIHGRAEWGKLYALAGWWILLEVGKGDVYRTRWGVRMGMRMKMGMKGVRATILPGWPV